ncbi:hypothetical protein VTH06DRAFT_5409 [Thermothelomyces fergusii]
MSSTESFACPPAADRVDDDAPLGPVRQRRPLPGNGGRGRAARHDPRRVAGELPEASISEAESSGRSTQERIEAIDAAVHPGARDLVKWRGRRSFDGDSPVEAYAWRVRYQRAHKHPALLTQPDPQPDPPAGGRGLPAEAPPCLLPILGGLPGGVPHVPSELWHLFCP